MSFKKFNDGAKTIVIVSIATRRMSNAGNIISVLETAILVSVFCLLQIGCGGGNDGDGSTPRPDVITDNAILDVQVVDGGPVGLGGIPPAPPRGYALLNVDLNEGTRGHYIWLYYELGQADGSEGQAVSKIYTVDEFDGEIPQGGTKLAVKNEGGPSAHEPLWLYYLKSNWPVARCIVVDRRDSD